MTRKSLEMIKGGAGASRLWFYALAALLLSASACRAPGVFPGAPVVLVSIDTLRADHLPAYGYRAVETPALDAFRKDSILFENAFAHVPLTLPSHASIFTGLLPFQHGVRDNLGYRLSRKDGTLATFLRARGYRTGGAVSAFVLDRSTGIGEGFDFYEDGVEARAVGQTIGEVQRPGAETEALLERWVDEQPVGSLLFLFLHIYEPHTPYAPPEPFKSRYASRPYDGEIAAADAVVRRFFAFLRAKSLYDRALIILVSDHGEGLGDHGEDEHGIFLYREAIRVPLFVKLPGSRSGGRSVSEPVGLVDVYPTVLSVLGEKKPEKLPGRSLLGARVSARRIYSETLYPRFHLGWSELASLNDGRFHYIEAPRPELYDWATDPAEKRDIVRELSVPFRSMRAELAGMSRPLEPPGAVDPETVKKLASLGYISLTSPRVSEKGLPDPKDRIAGIGRLKEASRLASEGNFEQAIAILGGFTRENPSMLDAWETLARILKQAGRMQEAFNALAQADRLQPGTPQVLLGLADLSLQERDFARAHSFAEAAAAAGAPNATDVLATISLAQGDLDTARREARRAKERNERARGPWLLLARIEREADNLPAALEALEKIGRLQEGKSSALQDSQFLRGDVLARLGRENEAEEAFRGEMRDFPENPRGWTGLALLYASQEKPEKSRQVLRDLVEKVHSADSYFAAIRAYEVLGERRTARVLRERVRRLFPGAREPQPPPG